MPPSSLVSLSNEMEDSRKLLEHARRSAEEARRVSEVTARLLRKSREIQHWKARVQGRVPGKSESEISFHSQSDQLLGLLPTAEFERLAPLLQGIRFRPRQVLQHANEAIESVYFPLSGLLSAMIVMRDGSSIEVALIGNEGRWLAAIAVAGNHRLHARSNHDSKSVVASIAGVRMLPGNPR